jgi:hypothetical protein
LGEGGCLEVLALSMMIMGVSRFNISRTDQPQIGISKRSINQSYDLPSVHCQ